MALPAIDHRQLIAGCISEMFTLIASRYHSTVDLVA